MMLTQARDDYAGDIEVQRGERTSIVKAMKEARKPPLAVEVNRARLPGPGMAKKTMTASTKAG